MTGKLILALDFGGTKHAAAVCMPGQRTWLRKEQTLTPPGADRTVDLDIMLGLAAEVTHGRPLRGIGVSFGGPVDHESGVVRRSHHVPGWENYHLKTALETWYQVPVEVENDANAAAFGELLLGAGADCSSMMFITISTGVGGGWILDRRIWHGADSLAGEIGHMTLDPTGPDCLCGKKGCLERLASGPYMVEDVRRGLENAPELGGIILGLSDGDSKKITGKIIAEAAQQGDVLAVERLDLAAWAVGTAIGNCANLMNPDLFVLGGGVSGAGERFWASLRARAREVALPEIQAYVVPAGLGSDAPLWGAALLAEEDSLG